MGAMLLTLAGLALLLLGFGLLSGSIQPRRTDQPADLKRWLDDHRIDPGRDEEKGA